ncbi:Fur family transcriptional regulator [Endomicrobium proavitum]|uniref:Transcriptional regulator n=1 Tax=Endomicrobium proavitum TaxID=1408281 RepID=A0A0G3WJV4_9BACT|nr:transcriptional repressor [Endomicrobium proavitum]AKL98578.1 Transcriptional regulator [Endomicrobium proavitum]
MITNKLSSSGLKQTFARKVILEFLEKTKTHPTADMIYAQTVKIIPTVSRTTVYNTVKVLAKEGIIDRVLTKKGEMRFDACKEPHIHFACNKCGKVFDIKNCSCAKLGKEVDGHKVSGLFICYSGICQSCGKKGIIKKRRS